MRNVTNIVSLLTNNVRVTFDNDLVPLRLQWRLLLVGCKVQRIVSKPSNEVTLLSVELASLVSTSIELSNY